MLHSYTFFCFSLFHPLHGPGTQHTNTIGTDENKNRNAEENHKGLGSCQEGQDDGTNSQHTADPVNGQHSLPMGQTEGQQPVMQMLPISLKNRLVIDISSDYSKQRVKNRNSQYKYWYEYGDHGCSLGQSYDR